MGSASAQPDLLTRLLVRRPAVGAVLMLIGGILAHDSLPGLPWLWISLIAVVLAIAIYNRRDGLIASISLALSVALLGLTLAQLQAYRYRPADISLYTTDEPRLAQLELRIDHPPRVLSREFDPLRALPPRQVFLATVARVHLHPGGWTDARGQILVQVDTPHPALRAEDTIRVLGMLQRPGAAMNPGQFDWARYYREQRILASLQIRSPATISPVASARSVLITPLRQRVRDALALGFSTRQSLDHALLRALLLGDSDPELRDVQEQFVRTGTSHHLAISGLHIAVLGGFVLGICRLINIRPRASAVLVAIFILLYGLVALPSPPVIRSVILCLSIGLGVLQRRSIDLLQLLALSAFGMLVYHPLDLFNAGFQLSFGTVLGLILLTGPIAQILRHRNALDLAPSESSRWQAIKQFIVSKGIQILAAALAAWLVSLPLVAFHFDRLNPWAMLGSIVLAPVVFMALILGFLKVVLTLMLPSFAATWAVLAATPIAWMRHMVDFLERFPGSDMPLPAPSIGFMALYYSALSLPLLWPTLQTRLPPALRLAPAAGGVALLCLPLLW